MLILSWNIKLFNLATVVGIGRNHKYSIITSQIQDIHIIIVPETVTVSASTPA